MSGERILDTNIVIGFLIDEPAVIRRLDADPEVMIPIVVLGELFYGACKSRHKRENTDRIVRLASEYPILLCDVQTSEFFGQIKQELEAKGRPIPDHDIWVAALARQHKLTVVSRDAHFREVDGLDVEEW